MILMIDNYDSFTYNIVQYIRELGGIVSVYRNDEISVDDVRNLCQVSGNMEYLKMGDKLKIGMKIGVLSGTADKRELDVKTNMRYK